MQTWATSPSKLAPRYDERRRRLAMRVYMRQGWCSPVVSALVIMKIQRQP